MSKLSIVKIIDLKEDSKFSNLVPEMTAVEYANFLESVKESGVNTPIHIRNDNTILDGRHRVKACKELGLSEIEALIHDITEEESIKFVRDTAIERRNLTGAQRLDIIFKSSDLVEQIKNEASINRKIFRGNRHTGALETIPDGTVSKESNRMLGELAGVSKNSVARLKKVRKEDPELYQQVLDDEKTISGAYNELPTTVDPKPRSEYPSAKKSNVVKLVIPEPEPMTDDETQLLVAVENLDFNFNQIIHYTTENQEKMYDAICQTYEERPDFMAQAYNSLEQLLNLMNAYQGGKHHEQKI